MALEWGLGLLGLGFLRRITGEDASNMPTQQTVMAERRAEVARGTPGAETMPTQRQYTVRDRLLRLQEIAARPVHGDQSNFHSCLWSEVRTDPQMMAMGMSTGRRPTLHDHRLVGDTGLDDVGAFPSLFGSRSIEVKRQKIASLLAINPARRA